MSKTPTEIAAGLIDDAFGPDPRVLVRLASSGPSYPGEYQHYRHLAAKKLVTLCWNRDKRFDEPTVTDLGRAVAAELEKQQAQ